MMGIKKDIKGQKFGRLIAVKSMGIDKHGSIIWLCQCECGNFKKIVTNSLMSSHTKSCGCLQREKAYQQNFKHGGRYTKLYGIWKAMKTRCYNLRADKYKFYGGRGIKVCSEWREDFSTFRNFALTHGYKEGLSIDRIDNNGNYKPSNIQFITPSENVIKSYATRKKRIQRRDNSGRFLGAMAT